MSDRVIELFEEFLHQRDAGGTPTRPTSSSGPGTTARRWPG